MVKRYIMSNNKIYDTIDSNAKIEKFDGGAWLEINNTFIRIDGGYVETDYIEDLIEVGDIIEFAVDFDYYVKSEVLDFQIIGEDGRKVINVFLDKVNYQSVKSIWKPVNNTFIRVCYKENGSWVID